MDELSKERVFLFVDGPNYSGGTSSNFQIDVVSLRDYFEKYGDIKKFFWYDVDPEISSIDFERVSLSKLEKVVNTPNVVEVLKTDEESLKQLLSFYESMKKTRDYNEGKNKFLHAVGKTAELITERGKTFRHSRDCHECGEEVVFVGKTEAGITDFNLGTDMVYYAGKNFYEHAILISGDGHFTKPVAYVRDLGKKVTVAYFDVGINPELKTTANNFLSLNSIRSKIERKF